MRLEVAEVAAEEDLPVGRLRRLIGGEQHLVGGGGEQGREVARGVEGALGEQGRVARRVALAAAGEEFAQHVGGVPAQELGMAALPARLVAGHGAGGDGLGHGVEDLRRVVVAGAGLGAGGDRGARPLGHQRVEQGAAGLVAGPAGRDGLGADGGDALGRQQDAGRLHGGVDAGDALALGTARFGAHGVEVRCGAGGLGRDGHGGLLGRGGRRGGGRRRRGSSRGLRRRLGHGGVLVGQGGFDRDGGRALRRLATHRRILIHRDRHDGDLEGLPIHSAVDGLASGGVGARLVAVHAIADADGAQRAVNDALPDRLDVRGGGELQRGVAPPALEAGGGDAAKHVAGAAAAMGVEHRRAAGAERLHPHRVRRHLQLLGDQAEGRDEVAGPRAGRPHHLDGAGGTIDGRRCRDGALRHERNLRRGGRGRSVRCGIAAARFEGIGHGQPCAGVSRCGAAAPVAAISMAAICAASWAAPDFATRRGSVSSARPASSSNAFASRIMSTAARKS
ncbi:MAG: hypothetical protein KatS3mg116_2429 [Elioraea sp.]|nr:MAG: hypothetical protein KatS3mg116_2429 [Elioraea sp.]